MDPFSALFTFGTKVELWLHVRHLENLFLFLVNEQLKSDWMSQSSGWLSERKYWSHNLGNLGEILRTRLTVGVESQLHKVVL